MKNSPTETRTTLLYSGMLALAVVSATFSIGVRAESDQQNKPSAAVEKSNDGKGVMPTFAEADIDNDHYITKAELKNFPYLLQVFDKVDAGQNGKLEQHEYQNLLMETKREGEVR